MSAHYKIVLFLCVKWVRDVEAGGSNPLTPTKIQESNQAFSWFGSFSLCIHLALLAALPLLMATYAQRVGRSMATNRYQEDQTFVTRHEPKRNVEFS